MPTESFCFKLGALKQKAAMRHLSLISAGLLLAACSQLPLVSKPQKYVATLQCGEIGKVQYSTSGAVNDNKHSITIGSKTWSGTEDGGSMRFFTPNQRTTKSPWMSFYQNKAWLYLDYKGSEGWSDLIGDQSSQYRNKNPELQTIECTPINRDDQIVGSWRSNDASRPWITISYTGDNNNTFNIQECDNSTRLAGCSNQTAMWKNDTMFSYQSRNSQKIIGQLDIEKEEITLQSNQNRVGKWIRKATVMLCSFNNETPKQATIRVGNQIKIQWSDGPKMSYEPIPPMNGQNYEDALGGRWTVLNRLQGVDRILKLENLSNQNIISCQANSKNIR